MANCWCGETIKPGSFSTDGLEPSCGGGGYLHCYCGGDCCVCHWHGGTECDGCWDCDPDQDDDLESEDADG